MTRILIVDDDYIVRTFFAHILGNRGYCTEEAEHGGHAIRALERHSFDLVIIDLFMPVREGIETIIEIRQRWPSTRVIAMSAGAGRMAAGGLLDLASGLGADHTLFKPVSSDLLLTSVAQMMKREGVSD